MKNNKVKENAVKAAMRGKLQGVEVKEVRIYFQTGNNSKVKGSTGKRSNEFYT